MEENNKNNQNEIIDSNNEKTVNSNVESSMNDELKKQTSTDDKKSIWDDLFMAGLFPYFLLIIVSIPSFFFGVEFLGSRIYGFEAVFLGVVFVIIGYWFIYIPATILIVISVIKKIKDKVHNWIWSN